MLRWQTRDRLPRPWTVVVEIMVLFGDGSYKRIGAGLQDEGRAPAVGLATGKDGGMITCEADDPELGLVGRPVEN